MGAAAVGHRVGATAALAVLLAVLLAARGGAQNVPADIILEDRQNLTGNVSTECVGRPDTVSCPDPDIVFYLYSGPNPEREEIDIKDKEWVKKSNFNKSLPTVLLVHGYRGGDSLPPMVLLKEAYIKHGTYNVIMTDWGKLTKVPCYVQAVNSMRAVAKCAGSTLSFFKDAGMNWSTLSCVGHSLGAHLCGILANYVPLKLEKIVGLDPGRPLMQLRLSDSRLDSRDAKMVQIIHTNTGFYGENGGSTGTVNFCVNNGKQPYCENTANEQLCSHLHSVCYMAESLYPEHARRGQSCTGRCPRRLLGSVSGSKNATMGEHVEPGTTGQYCVSNDAPPYCLRNATETEPEYGTFRCCPVYPSGPLPELVIPSEEEVMAALNKTLALSKNDVTST